MHFATPLPAVQDNRLNYAPPLFKNSYNAKRGTGISNASIRMMKIALTTSYDRMAPCFAGTELLVLDENEDLDHAQTVATSGWHPLAWGRELMRRDVGVLVCAGIDLPTWAGIRGHGIQIVPEAIGAPADVLAAWQNHQLHTQQLWPACGTGRGDGRRRRFRGGRSRR